jgi:hypothetical protein
MKQTVAIVCVLLSVACTRTEKWSMTLHKSVINTTGKDLYYGVTTDEGSRDAFINAFDSIDIKFYREQDVESFILGSTVMQCDIKIEREAVFNLTDTSRYEYRLAYEIIPETGNTEEEQIFARHLTWTLGNTSTDENEIIIINLFVTVSVLQIMQKVYTMLEKSKKYYEKKQNENGTIFESKCININQL